MEKLFIKEAFLLVFMSVLLISCNYLSGYNSAGKRGYSKSINESIKRGVFEKELNYITIPDTLNMKKLKIFIEKGFLYGEKSIYDTQPLLNSEVNKYQLIIANEHATSYFLKCRNFPIMAKWEISNNVIKDTIYFDVYNNGNYEKESFVGLMKVWDEGVRKDK